MALSHLKKTAAGALAVAASVAAPFNAMAGDFPPIFGASNVPGHFGMEVVRFVGDLGEPYMGNHVASAGGAAAARWVRAIEQEGPTEAYRLVITPPVERQTETRFANDVVTFGAVPSRAAWGPNARLVVCVQEKATGPGRDHVLGTATFRASDGEQISQNATSRIIPGGCEAFFKLPDVQRLVNQKPTQPPVAAKSAPRLAGGY